MAVAKLKDPQAELKKLDTRAAQKAQRAVTVPAPLDYSDLYLQYYQYTVDYMVTKYRIDRDLAPDYAHDIIAAFLKNGMLEQFNPTRQDHGNRHYTSFKTFYTAYMMKCALGHGSRLTKHRRREPITAMDKPGDKSGTSMSDSNSWWDERLTVFVDERGVEMEIIHDKFRQKAAEYQRQLDTQRAEAAKDNPQLRRNPSLTLPKLWDVLVQHLNEYGEVSTREVCKDLGVSDTTYYKSMEQLQTALGGLDGFKEALSQ